MKWRHFITGAAIGAAVGWFVASLIEKTNYSSEEILNKVKNELRKNGKITGSWIIAKPEKYEKGDIQYEVYRGGITRLVDNESTTYEFLADIKTGTVLDLVKLG